MRSPHVEIPSRWYVTLLAAAMLLLVVQVLALDYIVDDAFISFRYADNLVRGHGLTFNPGAPRVEGYTNFLWTLMMAVAIRAGLNPAAVAMLLGLGCGWVALVLTARLAAVMEAGGLVLLAPLLLAVNPAMVTWTGAGLETALFTVLVLAGTLVCLDHEPRRWHAAIAWSLACLTRPEGLLIVALLVLGLGWARGWSAVRRLTATWILVLLTVGSHALWRYLYYGAWLPNTFYAKTGDLGAQLSAGWVYVYDALTAFAGGPLFALILFLAWRRRNAATIVSTVLLLGWLVYVLVIGGDGLPMFRFVVPALPFLVALVTAAIARSLPRHRMGALVAAGSALVWSIVPGIRGPQFEYRELDRLYFVPKVIAVGKALPSLVDTDASIALLPAGAIPYYSRLSTVDMLALNDPIVARKDLAFSGRLPGHWKHDATEVLRQRPDYILLGNVDVTPSPRAGPIPPLFPVERELAALPGFTRDYERASLVLPDGNWLNCYRRRDTIDD